MKYLPSINKNVSLHIAFDLANNSSYQSGGIVPQNTQSNSYSVLNEMGFDLSKSFPHSGVFLGDASNIKTHFVDGKSSLGAFFNKNFAIQIEGSSSFVEDDSSFVISHTRNSRDVEILFSCIDDLNKKGFEFGINNANKLFFDSYSSSGKNTYVLNNIPYKKNIFIIKLSKTAGIVSLGLWDPSLQTSEFESFTIDPHYLNTNKVWTIGSGEYKGEAGINYNPAGYPCAGYIDKFFQFDDLISDEEVAFLSSSFYYDLNFIDEGSGFIDGYITGYNQSISNIVSGITGYQRIITGYYGQEFAQREYTTGEYLYGTVPAGGEILEEVLDAEGLGIANLSGIFRAVTVNTPTYGITGMATGVGYETYESSPPQPLYFDSGVSGVLYQEYDYTPLYSNGNYHKTSDSSFELTGTYPCLSEDLNIGYGPRSYTYLGARNYTKDFVETIKGVNLFSTNNFGGIFYSSEFEDSPVVKLNHDLSFNNEDIQLFINGVASQKGELNSIQQGNYRERFYVSGGDFYVYSSDPDGLYKNNFEIIQNDENLSIFVDTPIIDILQNGDFENYCISNISEYSQLDYGSPIASSAPSGIASVEIGSIDPSDKQVFFNGQKIYEGIDYFSYNQRLYVRGPLLEMTGCYFTCPGFRFDSEAVIQSVSSGVGMFDLNSSECFIPDSYVSYLNGIRLDPKAFVMHDSSVDLIEQGKSFIVENQPFEIYNNYMINRLQDRLADIGGNAVTGEDYLLINSRDVFGHQRDELDNKFTQGYTGFAEQIYSKPVSDF